MKVFADNLRSRADELGLSHAEVARRSGLTARAMSHYVTGEREPNLATLLRLASTLDTTPNELLAVEKARRARGKGRNKIEDRISATCRSLDDERLKLVDRIVRAIVAE